MTSKKTGFTLIEIMSSLLIFAIGGTMALSVFSFNASNRVELDERSEAASLANNILKTLVLQNQSGTLAFNAPYDTFKKSGQNIFPGHEDWIWNIIPVYPQTGTLTTSAIAATSPFYDDLSKPSPSTDSIFEYGYSIVTQADFVGGENELLSWERSVVNWDNVTNQVKAVNDDSVKFLRVVVTWPSSNPDRYKRKWVTAGTVIRK